MGIFADYLPYKPYYEDLNSIQNKVKRRNIRFFIRLEDKQFKNIVHITIKDFERKTT